MSLEDPAYVGKVTKSNTTPAQSASGENRIVPRDQLVPGLPVTRDKREGFDVMKGKVAEDGFVHFNFFPQFTHDFGPHQLVGVPTQATTKNGLLQETSFAAQSLKITLWILCIAR
jgi:hypothetical protein